MINIRKDMSYLSETDLQAIDKGIAELGVYSLRFSKFLSEEQKQENLNLAKTNKDLWEQNREKRFEEVAINIEKIIDVLNEQFLIYQYKNKEIDYSKDIWDLFFWCNDMTYVTLNPNKNKSLQQQLEDVDKVLSILNTLDFENIDVAIQYTVHYNNEKVNTVVLNVFNKIKSSFVNYQGYTGKIKEVGKTIEGKTVYGFFKKGAKTKYFSVPESWFLSNFFNQVEI